MSAVDAVLGDGAVEASLTDTPQQAADAAEGMDRTLSFTRTMEVRH